ncbi:MAG: ATP-binding protein [Thermodesulfobacteriota bacterium]
MNLATKIILSLLCVLIFFLGGFTYLIGKWQRAQLGKATQHYSMVLGEVISDSISTEMELGRSDKVQESLERIGKGSPHICSLRIFNQQGHILRSADPLEIGKTIDPIILQSHLRHVSTPFEHQIDGEPLISFIKPFQNSPRCQKCHDPKEKIIGFLDLDISIKPTLELVSSGERFLLISIGMTLLIVAGSIFLITSRWIQSPLSKVVGAMRKVEEGDLDVRVNLSSRDELAKVARTFNSMVETLSTAKKDLEILHQKELERVQKMATLGEMAAAMAHEIRNPLAGIASATKIIRSGLEKDDPRAEIFDEINEQIARLEKIVSNLLQFARTPCAQFSFIDIHEIIDRILNLLSYQIQNQRIEVEKEFQSNLPPIYADPEQIQQVLMNIVLNSIQAMPEGGKLRFGTFFRSEDKTVHLTIADTGIGISEEIIPKIFKPFYSKKAKGAGLGLAIVEKIIQEHRGKVTISSEVGVRTDVEITLPVSGQ